MLDKEAFKTSGILEQYVLGLTSEEENKEVQEHLHAFPELLEEVKAMQKALENYATTQSIPPPKHLKSSILQEIERLEQRAAVPETPNNGSSVFFKTWITPLSLVGLAASLMLAFFFYTQSQATQKKLETLSLEHKQLQQVCEDAQSRCAEREKILAFLQNEQTKAVYLNGTKIAPEASALVYYNSEDQNAYLSLLNIPPPPKGKQYQIWADVEGEMINMGLIGNQIAELQSLIFIPQAESFNITLEPVGGSKHPTVELLYVNGKV